jgi:hypothetical protein
MTAISPMVSVWILSILFTSLAAGVIARIVPLIGHLYFCGENRGSAELPRVFGEGPRKFGLQEMLYFDTIVVIGVALTAKTDKPAQRYNAKMMAVAIKKGQTRERAPDFKEMGTLRCDSCGEQFVVFHDPADVDQAVAARQAQWLEKVLAEEHDRERKHPDRIRLPD